MVLSNNPNKNPVKFFNQTISKESFNNLEYINKSDFSFNKYRNISFNGIDFNKNKRKIFDNKDEINRIKHYNTDIITVFNKSNIINRFSNMNIIDLKKLIPENPKKNNNSNDLITTSDSNLMTLSCKSHNFSNTIGNKFNKSLNNENNKIIKSGSNKNIKNKSINNLKNNTITKLKKKNMNKLNDINDIIKSIYDYSDDFGSGLKNIKKKSIFLEKIVEEENSPKNKFFYKEHGNKKHIDNNSEKEKNKNPQKMKLSLIEKYLISTDYSMNLNYKMR